MAFLIQKEDEHTSESTKTGEGLTYSPNIPLSTPKSLWELLQTDMVYTVCVNKHTSLTNAHFVH